MPDTSLEELLTSAKCYAPLSCEAQHLVIIGLLQKLLNPKTLPASDNFNGYSIGAGLNGLNGGTNWSGPYVDR